MARLVIVILLGIAAVACHSSADSRLSQEATFVFLTREGCATSARMRSSVEAALRGLNQSDAYRVVDQDSLPHADPRTGYPTPTLLYRGRDVFGMAEPKPPYPEPT